MLTRAWNPPQPRCPIRADGSMRSRSAGREVPYRRRGRRSGRRECARGPADGTRRAALARRSQHALSHRAVRRGRAYDAVRRPLRTATTRPPQRRHGDARGRRRHARRRGHDSIRIALSLAPAQRPVAAARRARRRLRRGAVHARTVRAWRRIVRARRHLRELDAAVVERRTDRRRGRGRRAAVLGLRARRPRLPASAGRSAPRTTTSSPAT
jgi:hypothetical protein